MPGAALYSWLAILNLTHAEGPVALALLEHRHRILLAILVVVVFSRLLGAGFVYDDLIIITDNPTIDSLSPAGIAEIFSRNYWYPHLEGGNLYRPIAIFTHAVEHAIVGETPWLYHLTNIVLHLLNVLLLHSLLTRLWPQNPWRTLLAAAVFAVHPAMSEAVCNVTCRADVLVVTIVLLACTIMTAPRWASRRPWILPLLAIGGLFTKENGIVLVPVVLLIDACQESPPGDITAWSRIRGAFVRHRAAYGLSTIAILMGLLVRFQVLGQSAPSTMITPPELNVLAYENAGVRMLTAIKTLGLAAFKFIWPLPLTFDYGTATITPVRTPLSPVFLASLVFWPATIWWAWRRSVREPLALVGLLIMLGALLPVSNLFFPITSIFNERFLYLPAMGLAILLAAVLPDRGLRWWAPVLVLVVVAGGALSWQRTADWRSVETITEATAAGSPRSASALMDLAGLRVRQGDTTAQGELLIQAVAAFPESPRANYALGQYYQRQDDLAQAMAHYEIALTERPTQTSLKAAMKLGFLNATSGEDEAAVKYFQRALRINPNEPGAHYNLALLFRNAGDPRAERHERIAAGLGRPLPPVEE